jgi:hypothetical protein
MAPRKHLTISAEPWPAFGSSKRNIRDASCFLDSKIRAMLRFAKLDRGMRACYMLLSFMVLSKINDCKLSYYSLCVDRPKTHSMTKEVVAG